MKTLILLINLVIASSFLTRAVAVAGDGPTNKVVLFATNYLLKLYPRDSKTVQQVSVPELKGFTLKQVAVIREGNAQPGNSAFEYVAVYQQEAGAALRVVLYNDQNEEQISLDSVNQVAFENDHTITRIVMQKTGQNGQHISEALLVPGTLEVAQKG